MQASLAIVARGGGWRAALAIVALSSAVACKGGGTAAEKPSPLVAELSRHPDTRAGAKALVERFLAPQTDHGALTRALRPRDSDYGRVFKPSAAKRAAKGYGKLWRIASRRPIQPRPQHKLVQVWGAKTARIIAGDDKALYYFPGGYKRIAKYLQTGLTVYRFKFTRADGGGGLAYDGLYRLAGRWVLMPKPWNVLDPPRRR